MTRIPTDIDALLSAEKSMAGSPVWLPDERGSVSKLAVPILDPHLTGGLILYAHATRFTDPQRGGCALVLDGRPIQRLSLRPDHRHNNGFSRASSLSGRRLPAERSRLHAWATNRSWPRAGADNVEFAETVEPEPESFSAGLVLFLRLCGIDGELPPPPWEPRLL